MGRAGVKVPRPKSVADVDVLDGALRVMRSAGPDGVTFQAVARETGLSAPTLVQRFGTKAGLLQAALIRAWDLLDAATEAADAAAPVNAKGAVAFLVALSGDYGEGDAYGDGLLVLREDMRDPVLRRCGTVWHARVVAALPRRLARNGRPADRLARLMAAQWQGAILWWGFSRRGKLPAAVQADLGDWLAAIGRRV